jgi:hypothetical protein
MAKLTIPIARSDITNPGIDLTTNLSVGVVTLSAGLYKIAAMGTSLKWRLGLSAVTASIGSYLADGDQELVRVPEDDTPLNTIRSPNATADGALNIVVANIFEIPGVDPANY